VEPNCPPVHLTSYGQRRARNDPVVALPMNGLVHSTLDTPSTGTHCFTDSHAHQSCGRGRGHATSAAADRRTAWSGQGRRSHSRGFEHFFREMTELVAAGPPLFADVVELGAKYGLEFGEPEWLPDVIGRYGLTPPPRRDS